MNVQELIGELMSVKDKMLNIYYVDNEYGEQEIKEVFYNEPNQYHPLQQGKPYFTLQ